MTDIKWIAEALERCEAATEGPWRNESGAVYPVNDSLRAGTNEDGEFAAHARTDLPLALELLAEAAEALEICESEHICIDITGERYWCDICMAHDDDPNVPHTDCIFDVLSRIREGGGG